MAMRIVVSAAGADDLRRAAEAARGVTGDVRVEAVALSGGGAVLAPRAADVADVAAAVGGLADAVLEYEAGDGPLGGDVWAAALVAAAGQGADGSADAVFLVDSPEAREAAGRAAVTLDAAAASMCDVVGLDADGRLTAERAVYGGVANGKLVIDKRPAVCLLTAAKVEAAGGAPAPVEQRGPVEATTPAVEVVGDEPVEKTVDLAGARIVVSVGRGLAAADDVAVVESLRAALGAELGCSRPIAEDFKWLPKERLVGLTGTSVTADLYVAVGISGQVQHLTGIKGARIVAAINNDPRAPIVRNADYVVQGDLYKVVPALVAALGGDV